MRPFDFLPRRLRTGSASLVLIAAATLGGTTSSSTAHANGRFPAATGVALDPVDPGAVLVRTTFGLLLVRDDGRLDWICEQLLGFNGVQDPIVAITEDESIAIAPFEGLEFSHDKGCSFTKVSETTGEVVIDLSVDKSTPSRIVAITSTGTPSGQFRDQTYESLDNGTTWHKVGPELGGDLLTETIDIAPSRPQRLYVSGITGPEATRNGVIAVSDDGGASWTRHDVDLAGDSSLFIAAVDPTDHQRVYVRTDGKENDRLLVSTDGGEHFTPIATLTGSMLGFALSPDGSRVAFGGPSAGLFLGDRGATSFELRDPTLPVACLAWSTTGLFACGSDFVNGFSVARTTDEGTSWKPVMPSLQSVSGPLSTCPANSPYQSTCVPAWPAVQAQLGIDPDAGVADAGVDAGAGSSGAAGTADAGVQTPSTQPADGCSLSSRPGSGSSRSSMNHGATSILALMMAGLLARRRRA